MKDVSFIFNIKSYLFYYYQYFVTAMDQYKATYIDNIMGNLAVLVLPLLFSFLFALFTFLTK